MQVSLSVVNAVIQRHFVLVILARNTCRSIRIPISARPRIQDQNKTIEAFVGDKVMLRCQVTGIPPPTVKWYKEIMNSGARLLEGKYI